MLLRAFAKINLDLRILGRRPDGYHEVRTILQTVDWFDEIRVERADRFEFSASAGPQDETNLVVKAVRCFEREARTQARVRIRLTKNIPIGAGLGGGSADAAVTLIGLQKFLDCRLETDVQVAVLRSLGSDVPFFAFGGRALGTGRGDDIELLAELVNDLDGWLVLVNPGVSIATAEAYSWLTDSAKSNNIEGFYAQFGPGSDGGMLVNDFEIPVFTRYPALSGIRIELLRAGAFRAALSGSGSVIFGQFRTLEGAERAAAELSGKYSVRIARPVSRAEYLSRMME